MNRVESRNQSATKSSTYTNLTETSPISAIIEPSSFTRTLNVLGCVTVSDESVESSLLESSDEDSDAEKT